MGMTVTKIFLSQGRFHSCATMAKTVSDPAHRVADPIPALGGALRNRWDFICWSGEAMP